VCDDADDYDEEERQRVEVWRLRRRHKVELNEHLNAANKPEIVLM